MALMPEDATFEEHATFEKHAFGLLTVVMKFLSGVSKQIKEFESLPESYGEIPWRRVYDNWGAYINTGLVNVLWTSDDLSKEGKGIFWCFTLLLPRGDGISRKTEDDGESWHSRSGRVPRKWCPEELLVNKLVLRIRGKCFEMLEFTMKNEEKPIVALCKISWKGDDTAGTPQIMVAASSSNLEASSQADDLSNGVQMQKMEIDHPKEESEGITEASYSDAKARDAFVFYANALTEFFNQNGVLMKIASSCPDDALLRIAGKLQDVASDMSNTIKHVLSNSFSVTMDAGESSYMNASRGAGELLQSVEDIGAAPNAEAPNTSGIDGNDPMGEEEPIGVGWIMLDDLF